MELRQTDALVILWSTRFIGISRLLVLRVFNGILCYGFKEFLKERIVFVEDAGYLSQLIGETYFFDFMLFKEWLYYLLQESIKQQIFIAKQSILAFTLRDYHSHHFPREISESINEVFEGHFSWSLISNDFIEHFFQVNCVNKMLLEMHPQRLGEGNPLRKVNWVAVFVIHERHESIELSEVYNGGESLNSWLSLLLWWGEMQDVVNYLQVLSSLHPELIGIKICLDSL